MSLDQLALDHSVLPPTWTPPAAPVRELVWTMDRATHDSVASVHGFTFRLTGEVNPIALAAALTDVLERHDALRLTTVMVNRRRRQQVEPVGAPLDLIDLRGVDPAQRLDRATHDSVASVHGFTFRLTGDVNPIALAAALTDVLERHDALRLTTVMVNRRRRQQVEPVGAPLDLIDMRNVDPGQRLDRARAVLATVLERPFNLARPPFLRAVLLRLAERDRMLGLSMHHVLCDGTSTGRLLDDLFEAYRAATAAAQVRLRFPDYEHRVPCDRHRIVVGDLPTTRVGRMDQRGEAPRPAGTTPGSGQDGGPAGPPSCSRQSTVTAVAS